MGTQQQPHLPYPNKDCGKLFFRLYFEGKYSEVRLVTIPCDFTVFAVGQSLHAQTKYPGTLFILNTLGQTVFRAVLNTGESQASLAVPEGLYIAKFIDKIGNIFTQKLFIK